MHAISRFLAIFVLVAFSAKVSNGDSPAFDSERAYKLLVGQCDFGSRNPGSPAHQKCLEWMAKYFKDLGSEVFLQNFDAPDPRGSGTFHLTNLIARIGDGNQPPLMLCAHWDCRPVADQEKDPKLQNTPIMGANDGASGVAVLMEIARLAAAETPPRSLLIVLFDGEDIGREGHPEEYAAGARYWATHQIPEPPAEAILLDMIGDADLRIPIEYYSEMNAPGLRRELWQIADRIGSKAFVEEQGPGVEDDHVPLQKVNISAVDLIDFDYPYWHTLSDTPDKCSAESLSQIGKVLVEYLYR